MAPKIILWGVSGILVPDAPVFSSALASVLGRTDVPARSSHLGTDRDAVGAGLAGCDDEAGAPSVHEIIARLEEEFAERRAEVAAEGRAPGSAELLSRLKQVDPGAVFAPLTGRTEANASLALGAVGLDRYFDLPLGTYGSDVSDREELFPAARVAVRERFGDRAADDVVLVTRNPIDARQARAAATRVIGVTPDAQVGAQLVAGGAMGVFADLCDVDRLAAAIAG